MKLNTIINCKGKKFCLHKNAYFCDINATPIPAMSQHQDMLTHHDCKPWDTGTELSGYVWHATNPKALVLLMHGYGDYTQRFAHQNNQLIPKLVSAGFTVCGFDMRGHGNSPGKRAVTDIRQAVRDHLIVRKNLPKTGVPEVNVPKGNVAKGNVQEAGVPESGVPETGLPVYLLGHSIGGLISVSSALDDPNQLAGIILLAPALLYRMDVLPVRGLLQLASIINPSWQVYRSTSLKDLTKDNTLFRPLDTYALDIAGQLIQDPLFYKGGMPVLVPASTLSLAHKNWKRYHELTIPSLAIHGTSDKATMPAGSKRFIDRISSADKTLELIDGAYHNLLDDIDRDRVVSLILNWLAERTHH